MATDKAGSTYVQVSFENPALVALLALITEACARSSRKIFGMKSKGDESSARLLAQQFVTDVLGVNASTTPHAASLMEPEPDLAQVKTRTSKAYFVQEHLAAESTAQIDEICKTWSTALAFVLGEARLGYGDRSVVLSRLRGGTPKRGHKSTWFVPKSLRVLSEAELPTTLLALSCRSALMGGMGVDYSRDDLEG